MSQAGIVLSMRTRTLAGVVLLAVVRFTQAETDLRNELLLAAPAHMGKEAGTPLDQVVDHLRDKAGRPVFANWRALEAAGIKRAVPVTVDLSGLTVGEAAAKLVKQFEDTPLAFASDEGVLTISTPRDLARAIETRAYDVRTLLGPDDAERPKRLGALIRRVQGVNPMSWSDNGNDNGGTVREVSGQLVVNQPPAMQRRVALELGEGQTIEQQTRLMRSALLLPDAPHPAKAAAPVAPAAPRTPVEATAAILNQKLPEIQFDKVMLSDALAFLQDTASPKGQPRLAIDVEWKELAKTKTTPQTPISVRLRSVELSKCLRVMLQGTADPADQSLATVQANGHVLITSKRDTYARYAVVQQHPFGDLARPADPRWPEVAKQISDLVVKTIAPDSWAAVEEGVGGTLTLDGDTMVITQTPDVHLQVADLLQKLRDQRLQVAAPQH